MWECPDFFPMVQDSNTWLLKASTLGLDYFSFGSFDSSSEIFTADDSTTVTDFIYYNANTSRGYWIMALFTLLKVSMIL